MHSYVQRLQTCRAVQFTDAANPPEHVRLEDTSNNHNKSCSRWVYDGPYEPPGYDPDFQCTCGGINRLNTWFYHWAKADYKMIIKLGDWIVIRENGVHTVLSDDQFRLEWTDETRR
jgi:hypothetical protein